MKNCFFLWKYELCLSDSYKSKIIHVIFIRSNNILYLNRTAAADSDMYPLLATYFFFFYIINYARWMIRIPKYYLCRYLLNPKVKVPRLYLSTVIRSTWIVSWCLSFYIGRYYFFVYLFLIFVHFSHHSKVLWLLSIFFTLMLIKVKRNFSTFSNKFHFGRVFYIYLLVFVQNL